jgi:predicted transcriptional regulator
MEAKKEELSTLKSTRVLQLQRMLADEKRELLKKVTRHSQSLLASSKCILM